MKTLVSFLKKLFHNWELYLWIAVLQILCIIMTATHIASGGKQIIWNLGNGASFNFTIFALFIIAMTFFVNISIAIGMYVATYAKKPQKNQVDNEIKEPWAPTKGAHWDGPEISKK